MLRDILLNHAWGLFNHSELTLLEESLKALPWESLLENPRLVLLQAWLMQSQHRYGEVNTAGARRAGNKRRHGANAARRIQRFTGAGSD